MLKFVICDDDIHMLDRISSLLEKVIVANDFDAKVVYKTTDFKELLSYISENKIDVVILDIEFYGNLVSKYKQIGNAVPVNLSYHIGCCLVEMLDCLNKNSTEEQSFKLAAE